MLGDEHRGKPAIERFRARVYFYRDTQRIGALEARLNELAQRARLALMRRRRAVHAGNFGVGLRV